MPRELDEKSSVVSMVSFAVEEAEGGIAWKAKSQSGCKQLTAQVLNRST